METEEDEGVCPRQDVEFCTLGMFIIDEIHYQPPKPSVYNIIGGAGSYSALGARLFSPGSESKKVGWIVDKGSDFPNSIESTIKSWKTSCSIRNDGTRLTTRGWNGYDASENRAFRYATPKLRLDENSLAECEPLLRAKAFHLICSPTRCINLVNGILHLRRGLPDHPPRPIFIWEPVPDFCVPDQLLETTRALRYVDICSPNHAELGALMGTPAVLANGDVDRAFVEDATEQLLGSMPLSTFAIVVRAGKDGCYIGKNGGGRASKRSLQTAGFRSKQKKKQLFKAEKKRPRAGNTGRGLTADSDFEELFARLTNNSAAPSDSDPSDEEKQDEPDWGTWTWLPAVHNEPSKVIDPTGGGNAFLGGLAVALARGSTLLDAAKQGMVAASFAIEQVGVPTLGMDALGNETWNGVVPHVRARNYRARMCNGPTSGHQLQ